MSLVLLFLTAFMALDRHAASAVPLFNVAVNEMARQVAHTQYTVSNLDGPLTALESFSNDYPIICDPAAICSTITHKQLVAQYTNDTESKLIALQATLDDPQINAQLISCVATPAHSLSTQEHSACGELFDDINGQLASIEASMEKYTHNLTEFDHAFSACSARITLVTEIMVVSMKVASKLIVGALLAFPLAAVVGVVAHVFFFAARAFARW